MPRDRKSYQREYYQKKKQERLELKANEEINSLQLVPEYQENPSSQSAPKAKKQATINLRENNMDELSERLQQLEKELKHLRLVQPPIEAINQKVDQLVENSTVDAFDVENSTAVEKLNTRVDQLVENSTAVERTVQQLVENSTTRSKLVESKIINLEARVENSTMVENELGILVEKLNTRVDQLVENSTKPDLEVENSTEQPLTKTSQIVAMFKMKLPVICLYSLVLSLTTFVVVEQIDFYQLKNYGLIRSFFYASILDICLVGLSFLASWLPKKGLSDWNWLVIPMLLVCIAALGSITFVHVGKRSQAVEGLSTEQVELKSLLTKRVGELEARSKLDLAAISDMPDSYVTARKEAQERYDASVGKELKEARQKLEGFLTQNAGKSAVSQVEQWSMIGFRWLAILLNVLFAGLAGALVRKNGA